MRIFFRITAVIVSLGLFVSPLQAKNKTPISDTALDGGNFSAESLGRGNTIASNRATPAAGSENPAGLADSSTNASYATALVHTSTILDREVAQTTDPLSGKVLQYMALQGEKGAIFFEPLGRQKRREILDSTAPSTEFRDVEYEANAFGFAGTNRLKAGSIGLSMAYLRSSIGVVEHHAGVADQVNFDTGDGLRINFGIRYPTGPAMWGFLVQNAPGIVWSKDYRRQFLPVKVRFGNTLKIMPGTLLSVDWERRFYREGSRPDNFVYVGSESFLSKIFVLRAGVFGPDVTKSEKRHVTLGLGWLSKTGAQLSYAMEIFSESDQKVRRSVVSFQAPFQASE